MLQLSISRDSKGFTLVELMVVIAIIGILAAALFPAMSQYMGRSRNTQRLSDIRNMNTGLKGYYIDYNSPLSTRISSVDNAVCIGVGSGGTCWNDYTFLPAWATVLGRTGAILGSTSVNDILKQYIPNLPIDPLSTRRVGDRYIISTAPGDVHCDGSQTVWQGGWIIWQPEKLQPTTDKECLGQGEWGCCSGVGCGSPGFCLTRVDI